MHASSPGAKSWAVVEANDQDHAWLSRWRRMIATIIRLPAYGESGLTAGLLPFTVDGLIWTVRAIAMNYHLVTGPW